jgi:hypothetical protein
MLIRVNTEKDSLTVWVDGVDANAKREFVEDGTEAIFHIGEAELCIHTVCRQPYFPPSPLTDSSLLVLVPQVAAEGKSKKGAVVEHLYLNDNLVNPMEGNRLA